jgi:hypothetical protein
MAETIPVACRHPRLSRISGSRRASFSLRDAHLACDRGAGFRLRMNLSDQLQRTPLLGVRRGEHSEVWRIGRGAGRAAGVAHDGQELGEQRREAVHRCAVVQRVAGDLGRRSTGAFGRRHRVARGRVSVGVDYGTAEFAVQSIKRWWLEMARRCTRRPSGCSSPPTVAAATAIGHLWRL